MFCVYCAGFSFNLCFCYVLLMTLFACFRYRLPFWPYIKGVVTFFLVVQCFAGACYIYNHFIRSYILGNSLLWKLDNDSISRDEHYVSSEQENFVNVVEQSVFKGELHEPDRFVTVQVHLCAYIFANLWGQHLWRHLYMRT